MLNGKAPQVHRQGLRATPGASDNQSGRCNGRAVSSDGCRPSHLGQAEGGPERTRLLLARENLAARRAEAVREAAHVRDGPGCRLGSGGRAGCAQQGRGAQSSKRQKGARERRAGHRGGRSAKRRAQRGYVVGSERQCAGATQEVHGSRRSSEEDVSIPRGRGRSTAGLRGSCRDALMGRGSDRMKLVTGTFAVVC